MALFRIDKKDYKQLKANCIVDEDGRISDLKNIPDSVVNCFETFMQVLFSSGSSAYIPGYAELGDLPFYKRLLLLHSQFPEERDENARCNHNHNERIFEMNAESVKDVLEHPLKREEYSIDGNNHFFLKISDKRGHIDIDKDYMKTLNVIQDGIPVFQEKKPDNQDGVPQSSLCRKSSKSKRGSRDNQDRKPQSSLCFGSCVCDFKKKPENSTEEIFQLVAKIRDTTNKEEANLSITCQLREEPKELKYFKKILAGKDRHFCYFSYFYEQQRESMHDGKVDSRKEDAETILKTIDKMLYIKKNSSLDSDKYIKNRNGKNSSNEIGSRIDELNKLLDTEGDVLRLYKIRRAELGKQGIHIMPFYWLQKTFK